MVDVFDVAKWFLSKESMTHKKLQKLCYYAQAWHYTLLGEPLFADEVQAWIHGPVIPTLYKKYHDHGWRDIPQNTEVPVFPKKTEELLERVYCTYGEFTGNDLEGMTHSEMPWIKARNGLQYWEQSTNPIVLEDMRAFYLGLYNDYQND